MEREISPLPRKINTDSINHQNEEEEETWGMHINQNQYMNLNKFPVWGKPVQRESWNSRGIIIWEKQTQQVTKLWASQGMELLVLFRKTTDWKESGVIVGEPVVQFSVERRYKKKNKTPPAHESKWVLANQIQLNGIQSQELFSFLIKNEFLIREMASIDGEERKRALEKVYDMKESS